MNKRTFTYLLILMGLSILGVIGVQLVWINNAIRVKNELFDRSINEALQKTANKLERRQDVEVLAGLPTLEDFHWDDANLNAPPTPPKPIRIVRKSTKAGQIDYKFEVGVDTNMQVFAFADGNDSLHQQEIIVSHEDTILTNTHTFFNSRKMALDSLESAIDTLIEFSPHLKKRIEIKTERLKDLTTKVVSEISFFGQEDLKLADVRELVSNELADKNMPTDFEIALLDNDTISELSNEKDSISLAESPYQVRLFPNAVFDQNKKLALFIPSQTQFIYQSVSWLLIASLFFSLVILITFGVSIFFLLRQKKISEMKSDFINNMTHEFKTPIATISVAADSINNEKVISNPEQVNYFVGMIKKENTRMNRQVEDILTIARLDKKDFEFKWESLNIHQLTDDVIQSIQLQVEKKGGSIKTNYKAINPNITTDKTHFANVIYNLIDNANKYSINKPEIKIDTINTPKGIIISVSDKGIGMSKSVQSKVFERFYRQSSGNIHNVKGFGLGLSYVKAVVEANNGNITVKSDLGKGTQFNVFLPYLKE
ncbi:sensor histidine kinase [Sunxiuqinia sp. A32]|uniref:sensor histidine kinase n=1 Tax=Sunxiuqinia sp. A32 TaxID=3461496 RepID=UPI0040464771